MVGQASYLVNKHCASNASSPYQGAVGQGTIVPNHQHLHLPMCQMVALQSLWACTSITTFPDCKWQRVQKGDETPVMSDKDQGKVARLEALTPGLLRCQAEIQSVTCAQSAQACCICEG